MDDLTKSRRKTYNILSFDGGGIRGLLALRILLKVQRDMREHLQDATWTVTRDIDMLTGTSVGAFFAATLGIREESLERMQTALEGGGIHEIFDKSCWDRIANEVQFRPKYDGKGKRRRLQELLGTDTPFSRGHRLVMIPVVGISNSAVVDRTTGSGDHQICVHFMTNHMLRDAHFPQLRAWQVADASSAAPAYFPSVQMCLPDCMHARCRSLTQCTHHTAAELSATDSVSSYTFVDGGCEVNNPAAAAVAVANHERRRKGIAEQDMRIRILSLGCGASEWTGTPCDTRHWGGIQWMGSGKLLHLLLGDTAMEQICELLVRPEDYVRVNGALSQTGVSADIDDTSDENLRAIDRLADHIYTRQREDMIRFFSEC